MMVLLLVVEVALDPRLRRSTEFMGVFKLFLVGFCMSRIM